ncbi:MAG: RNA-protein complex protein Nop10 [Thermoplasmatota archaeon]
MRHMMRYCSSCQEYTLEDCCPRCGQRTDTPEPARFSPQDPYGEYRRRLKKEVKE